MCGLAVACFGRGSCRSQPFAATIGTIRQKVPSEGGKSVRLPRRRSAPQHGSSFVKSARGFELRRLIELGINVAR